MNLDYSAEDRQFRDEVRAFLRNHLPPEIAGKVHGGRRMTKDDYVRWQKILHARGWGASSWPLAHGGTG